MTIYGKMWIPWVPQLCLKRRLGLILFYVVNLQKYLERPFIWYGLVIEKEGGGVLYQNFGLLVMLEIWA